MCDPSSIVMFLDGLKTVRMVAILTFILLCFMDAKKAGAKKDRERQRCFETIKLEELVTLISHESLQKPANIPLSFLLRIIFKNADISICLSIRLNSKELCTSYVLSTLHKVNFERKTVTPNGNLASNVEPVFYMKDIRVILRMHVQLAQQHQIYYCPCYVLAVENTSCCHVHFIETRFAKNLYKTVKFAVMREVLR